MTGYELSRELDATALGCGRAQLQKSKLGVDRVRYLRRTELSWSGTEISPTSSPQSFGVEAGGNHGSNNLEDWRLFGR